MLTGALGKALADLVIKMRLRTCPDSEAPNEKPEFTLADSRSLATLPDTYSNTARG